MPCVSSVTVDGYICRPHNTDPQGKATQIGIRGCRCGTGSLRMAREILHRNTNMASSNMSYEADGLGAKRRSACSRSEGKPSPSSLYGTPSPTNATTDRGEINSFDGMPSRGCDDMVTRRSNAPLFRSHIVLFDGLPDVQCYMYGQQLQVHDLDHYLHLHAASW